MKTMHGVSRLIGGLVGLAMIGAGGIANATLVHDETVDGDLGAALAETSLGTLGPGSFEVFGTMRDFDEDFFSFSVSVGDQFGSLILLEWSTDSSNPFSVRITDSLSLACCGVDEFSLGNLANVGQDLIGLAGVGPFGSGGFSAGTRTGLGVVSYGFQIVISQVPGEVSEPSTFALFAIALAGLGFFMTRRRRVV